MFWIVYGGNGWIGTKVCEYLSRNGEHVYKSKYRADNEADVEKEFMAYEPDRVLCFIGRTHGENNSTIDYLEQPGKLSENIKDNLYAPLVLAHMGEKYNVHVTYLGTGCIFDYNEDHPLDSDIGFTEDDKPNFFGSSYSITKGFTDRIMKLYRRNVLNIRIRMPIASDLSHRNFITKITNYAKICSIPNSMTVLDDMIPIIADMAFSAKTGTINLTNPGVISHNEILQKYKDIVDPDFTWENFTKDEQSEVLKSDRSNNFLDTSKLQQWYPEVNDIHTSVVKVLHKIKNLQK